LVGIDIFVHWNGLDPDEVAQNLKKISKNGIELTMIKNRGLKVWLGGFSEIFRTDYWTCRFKPIGGLRITKEHIYELLKSAVDENIDTIKTKNLYEFDGVRSYSLG
jgi:isocitrate dehydrogenase